MYTLNAGYVANSISGIDLPDIPGDTILPQYPIAKITPEVYQDITKCFPVDLRTPENIITTVEYDVRTGSYIVRSRVGGMELGTPLSLTPEEYLDFSLQQSMNAYFRRKNQEEHIKSTDSELNITDMRFAIGVAERLFGSGGIRIKTQGSAELSLGMKRNTTKDPSLPERARSRTFFNMDENIQLNVQASVGSKVNFDMNYNTESSFDFDSKKLKLTYTGEDDEIIKSIEAGNVRITTGNSLINGGTALFGLKADLQFGKLRVNTLFAQQESESKTVNSKGGVQTRPFELTIDQYDENRHFFLSHYFYGNYDEAMATLPYINTPVNINRIEVWVTNKRNDFDLARNIVAFSDLAENKTEHIGNNVFIQPSGTLSIPQNEANTLYRNIVDNYPDARNIGLVNQILSGVLDGGKDFEKIESARKLEETEYTLNKQLGYISLKSQLQPDEVLAVAYEYQYNGNVYQVGEFSTDNTENTTCCLYVKLLKGSLMAPQMAFWRLMMKNVYSLGAYSIQKEKFRLDVLFQSDTTGTYVNYIPEGNIKDTLWLRVMNLDRLDTRDNPRPDGIFDFVENYTVQSETGHIIFPVTEPFGEHLRTKIGNNNIADKYVYQELYDSTLTVARQIAEKNKFILRGEYKASSGAEIELGATNIAQGSVRVTAGGVVLSENIDYTVDYISGRVTILNESILSAGTPINASLENQTLFNMQRKTMVGLDLNYQFCKDFNVGATIMHLSEKPLAMKIMMGDESVKNTLWGLNTSYKTESQWLTNVFDKLPLLILSKPSHISFNAEFAHLIAGYYENKYTGGYSYLDDFESTQSGYSIHTPYAWNLAGTPYDDSPDALFPEAGLVNNVDYGKNRALLAWYHIDGLFTRRNSSLIPRHITKDDLSNHYVRSIEARELYPYKDYRVNEASTLPILNLAYYPTERGPYNLDAVNIAPDGLLINPEKRWGGIMRKIEQSDFEAANVEYIEFWLLDPFIYNPGSKGGDLYFNLGDISEDILKDEKKFFENGLPIDGDESKVEVTTWGKVPRQQSTVYAFDNSIGARKKQDVGLNGLSSEEEKIFPAYQEYLKELESNLAGETILKMQEDPFSPFNDPAGDNYQYFRGDYYDRIEADILTRYKRYNGTEGNSCESTGKYDISAKRVPDVEDINQDNTLNENEKYFEYKVSLRPEDLLQVGSNYITEIREVIPKLVNGTTEPVKWYLFKVPVKKYNKTVGSIRDFKTIRFMRLYMTGFHEQTTLRFGTLELVRGEWRTYEQNLSAPGTISTCAATIEVSSVNIEENGDRRPVNYVLPPGISRMPDHGQQQVREENEQALSLKVLDLNPQDARAVYKSTNYDLRQYKRLQLFTHAEATLMNETELRPGELSVFIRLGSDYRNNYYEYEVPLSLTPHGIYNTYSNADREAVWPVSNMLNFKLDIFTNLKLSRNRAKKEGINEVGYQTIYAGHDPEYPQNRISIIGNPSLAEVKTIMIGVRNNSGDVKSAEIWVNELRLTDFNEEGGWAANANMNIALSDLGTVNVSGRMETAGFGALDQSMTERRLDDYKQYNITTNIQLGKLFPEKAKVNFPLYYTYSKEVTTPKYNPLDQDIKLSEALEAADTKAERDSIRNFVQGRTALKSITFNNVKVDIKSKTPMPYDPANFSLGFSYSENNRKNPETEYETTKDYRAGFVYNYSPGARPFRPFRKIRADNGYTLYIRQLSLNYMPANINFQTYMARNYYEIQLRDLTNTGEKNNIPVSFSQDFLWDRAFRLTWNFSNNLLATFSSGTNARIEEPHIQVNKKLNPDQYKVWKDSVKQSIRDLGTPLKYDQNLYVVWNMPLQFIPVLDWTSSSLSYNTTYNWNRGATAADPAIEVGNTIKNQRTIDWTANFNLQALYNKNKYLRGINRKFSTNRTTSRPKASEFEGTWQHIADYSVRFLMMIRRLTIQYSVVNGMMLPGFLPEIGDIFGQKQMNGLIPGLGFAFGSVRKSYIEEVKEKDWLIIDESNITPAMMNRSENLTIRVYLEPFNGLKVDLNANRVDTRDTEIDFMYKDMPERTGGRFVMTTITLTTAFQGSGNPKNGYKSKAFDNFLTYRDIIAGRIQQRYEGTAYPDKGFIAEAGLGGHDYNSHLGKVGRNSTEVLIPAFLAAYSGKDPGKIKTTPFPSVTSLLPNWRITYDGLICVPAIKKYFKSFVLSHQYRSSYNVGSYNSYLDWVDAGDGLGYIRNIQQGNPMPSSGRDISSVHISEGFTPLLGADATLLNNVTGKMEYRKTRNLNLNISSFQLVEGFTDEYVVGVGYKVADFNKKIRRKVTQDFNNDLTVRLDFSYNKMQSLIRKIENNLTQATSGNIRKTFQFTVDYNLSRMLTLRAFYDLQINEPLISSVSFPTSNSKYGVSLRISLAY